MSKSLLGGSAAIALLTCSLIFQANPTAAEPLALIQESSVQQENGLAATSETADTPAAAQSAQDAAENSTDKPRKEKANPTAAGSPASQTETAASAAGQERHFVATAYSLRGRTASGRPVSRGLIAADHKVLPLGTRVRLEAGGYSGEYVVADTGGAVRGRKIDIWVPNSSEAMRFGRRPVKLTVLTRTRKPSAPPAKPR